MYHNPRPCHCGSGLFNEAEYDGRGIFLCYVCDKCRDKELSKYNPVILGYYDQSDVDEPIEPEDDDY
jgi:hypothetical protein